jgi:hypothetical protein
MANSIKDSNYNPEPSVKAEVGAHLRSMILDMAFKPADSYVPRITVSSREKTPEEIEIEEVAKKYGF